MNIITIEMPNYITQVKMSNSRRPKYFSKTDKIPKKYQAYGYDSKGRLCGPDGQPIVKNSKSVNNPRYKRINGQDFYSGLSTPIIRVKIVNAIKDFYRPFLEHMPKIKTFPIQIECKLYDVPGKCDWDLDNKWIYCKVFQDLLVNMGKIPDDNIRYVSRSASIEFHAVENEEDKKLVFIIKQDHRTNDPFY
jgi:hypothetical protein